MTIDQTLIDRVARAIYAAESPVLGDTWWDMLCRETLSKDHFPETYRKKAISAIKAMEEYRVVVES